MAGFYANFKVEFDQIVDGGKKGSKSKVNKQFKAITNAISISSGIIVSSGYVINSKVGSYTGNKVKQANIKNAFTVASKVAGAVGLFAKASTAGGPVVGAIIAGGGLALDTINTITDITIKQANMRQEFDYKNSLIGNMATSGSRWKGNYR